MLKEKKFHWRTIAQSGHSIFAQFSLNFRSKFAQNSLKIRSKFAQNSLKIRSKFAQSGHSGPERASEFGVLG
jgi:hypothetical protein